MEDSTKPLSKGIRIDESEIRGHLDEMCNVQRYEHSPYRIDTRAGSYTRKLHTRAGDVELKMPKLRNLF